MLIVPVRKVEEAEGGINCLLGSEPGPEAESVFLPMECVLNRVDSEPGGLSILTLDGSRIPEGIRKLLGMG
jgi:hypothetical protein